MCINKLHLIYCIKTNSISHNNFFLIPIIKKNMSDVSASEYHQFSIPLTVDINSGNNWDEAH